MKIAILGATGYIGTVLINELLTSTADEIIASFRQKNNQKKLSNKRLRWEEVNLSNPENIEKFLKGCDVLIYLIHSLKSSKFDDLDTKFAHNVGLTAKKMRIKKIIYMGVITPKNEKLSSHLKNKKKTGEILASYGIPVGEVRLSILLGNGSASYKIFYFLAKNFPIMLIPKEVNNYCSPIGIDDTIDFIIKIIERKIENHEILEIGSEKLSYKQLLYLCQESIFSRRKIIITIPIFPLRLIAFLISVLSKIPFPLTYALIETLANNTSYSENRFREIMGRNPQKIEKVLADLSKQMKNANIMS